LVRIEGVTQRKKAGHHERYGPEADAMYRRYPRQSNSSFNPVSRNAMAHAAGVVKIAAP